MNMSAAQPGSAQRSHQVCSGIDFQFPHRSARSTNPDRIPPYQALPSTMNPSKAAAGLSQTNFVDDQALWVAAPPGITSSHLIQLANCTQHAARRPRNNRSKFDHNAHQREQFTIFTAPRPLCFIAISISHKYLPPFNVSKRAARQGALFIRGGRM